MASYRNPYNEAIANQQRRFDYANMKNDYAQSLEQPLNGGAMLEGGDFWSDFSDGFMSVWNPIIDTVGKVAPLLPLVGLGEEGVGLTHSEMSGMGHSGSSSSGSNSDSESETGMGMSGGECQYGMGMSGGDMSVNAPYEGYVYGSGSRSLVNQPYLGYGKRGGAIANDGQPPFNMITNAGMSGGRASNNPKYVIKQNDYCCVKNNNAPMPCNGNPLPKAFMNDYKKKSNDFSKYREGKLPGYKGHGLSGGDEISDTDHPIIRNPELQATMFLGGRKPSAVSKKEKIGMVQQVIADMLSNHQLKGMGMSGGDFDWSSLLSFAPLLLGLGASGGKMSHKQLLEKKFVDKLFKKQLKTLHGKGMSGGDFDWSSLLSFAPLLLGLGMSGGNVDMGDLSEFEPLVKGLGYSGGDFWDSLGKGFSDAWNWVSGNADSIGKVVDLGSKIVKATGAGMSGGMYDKSKYHEMPDGSIMPNSAMGMGMSGGMTHEQDMNMADAMGDIFSGMGASGGSNASDTRMKSGAVQLYKGGKKKQTRQDKMNERLAMKIAHLQGKGMEPTADMEASNKLIGLMAKANPNVDNKIGLATVPAKLDPVVPPVPLGRGVSGGKKTSKWIEHVKAYAKSHNIKYGDALKQAKSTYRG